MKKFMTGLILVGILSSCTYNTYAAKQDDQLKSEIKQAEPIENYSSIKAEMDQLINICNNKEDSPCIFMQANNVDHFVLIYPNEKEMRSSEEFTTNIAATFCLSSMKLSIPAQFHVALLYERITHEFNCSTDTWSQWHSIDEPKNNRN